MTQQEETIGLLDALLTAMETGVIPATERGVAAGIKVFGAALLR